MSDERFVGTPRGDGSVLWIPGDNVTFENMALPDHIRFQGTGATFVNCTFGAVRKSTCCGFYPAWTDESVEVCASCMKPVSEQPTDAEVEESRALDDDADMYAENRED